MYVRDNEQLLFFNITFNTRGFQLVACRHAAHQTNLQLQGRKLLIAEMYGNIESFKVKPTLWRKQLSTGNLLCFSKLESSEGEYEYTQILPVFLDCSNSLNCVLKISGPLNHIISFQPTFLPMLNALQNSCRWN